MITVLMPVYNSASVLRRSVMSILGQTFRSFELLIVDDGSTDGTEELVRSFTDERIRYIRLPHRGIAAALNAGLDASSYDVIARMDAGDIALPERLQQEWDMLNEAPEHIVVSCHYAIFAKDKVRYVVRGSSDPAEVRRRLALHPDIPHPGVMYRRSFVSRFGGYREVPLEDYDLWLRMKDVAEFRIMPIVLMLVEHASTSLTNADVGRRYSDHYALQEPYFTDLALHFGIISSDDQFIAKAWREYFYGDPALARYYWRRSGRMNVRSMIAFAATHLSRRSFLRFKEHRWRQRLEYLYGTTAREARDLQRILDRAMGKGH